MLVVFVLAWAASTKSVHNVVATTEKNNRLSMV